MPIVNISGTAKPVGQLKAFLSGASKPAPNENELDTLRRRVDELESLVDKQEREIVHLRETR